MFSNWCEEVIIGFKARHVTSLPIKVCQDMHGATIDTRTFIEITT